MHQQPAAASTHPPPLSSPSLERLNAPKRNAVFIMHKPNHRYSHRPAAFPSVYTPPTLPIMKRHASPSPLPFPLFILHPSFFANSFTRSQPALTPTSVLRLRILADPGQAARPAAPAPALRRGAPEPEPAPASVSDPEGASGRAAARAVRGSLDVRHVSLGRWAEAGSAGCIVSERVAARA